MRTLFYQQRRRICMYVLVQKEGQNHIDRYIQQLHACLAHQVHGETRPPTTYSNVFLRGGERCNQPLAVGSCFSIFRDKNSRVHRTTTTTTSLRCDDPKSPPPDHYYYYCVCVRFGVQIIHPQGLSPVQASPQEDCI